MLNHFSTPLGLSLASLLSHLFLPPSAADLLSTQGFAGRQVVLAQNSRDFVFIRRYRYMFALKSHQLGSKKKVGLEKLQAEGEDEDEVIKARFQEIGPKMTVKMRWIRRGALGETGDERDRREKSEREAGVSQEQGEFGEVAEGEDPELGEVGGVSGKKGKGEKSEEEEEKLAAKEIGLVEGDETSQPNFDFAAVAAAAEASASGAAPAPPTASTSTEEAPPAKRPRTTPRKRSKPYHALLRPPPSPSPPPGGLMESEAVPLPPKDGKKKHVEQGSLLSTVGKSWHAGKGEGGVREGKKRQEWGWEVSWFSGVARDESGGADALLVPILLARRPKCRSRGGSSSSEEVVRRWLQWWVVAGAVVWRRGLLYDSECTMLFRHTRITNDAPSERLRAGINSLARGRRRRLSAC